MDLNESINQTIVQTASSPIATSWNDAIASLINSIFNTTFEGSIITGILPAISLLLIAWKWHTVLGFLQQYGMFVILAIAFYTGGKALGFL